MSPLGREILRHLDSPMRRIDLRNAVGSVEDNIVAQLAVLNECRLLFNDGDRMLNLVTSGIRGGAEVLQ